MRIGDCLGVASPPLAPYLRGAGVGAEPPRVLWDEATSQRLRDAGLGDFEVHPRWREAMATIVREGPAAVSAARIAFGPDPEERGAKGSPAAPGKPQRTPGERRPEGEPYPEGAWTAAELAPYLRGAGVQSPTDDFLARHTPSCRCQICSGAYREMGPSGAQAPPGTTTASEDGPRGVPASEGRVAAIEVPASPTCSGGRLTALHGPLAGRPYVPAMRPLYCPICGRHRTVSVDLRRFLHTGSVKHRPCAACMRTHGGPRHHAGRTP
jgi:hypothetical protein